MFVIVMIDLQKAVLDGLEKEIRENIIRNAAEGIRITLTQELKSCEEMMQMYPEKTLIGKIFRVRKQLLIELIEELEKKAAKI